MNLLSLPAAWGREDMENNLKKNEISTRVSRLGMLVMEHVLAVFPELTPDGTQWLLVRVFGVLIPHDVVLAHSKFPRLSRCDDCWSLSHNNPCTHWGVKQEMADLMLDLEADIDER